MSVTEFRGAAYAIQRWMQAVQAEIDRGERKGAVRRWSTPNYAKVGLFWFKRRLLVRKRA